MKNDSLKMTLVARAYAHLIITHTIANELACIKQAVQASEIILSPFSSVEPSGIFSDILTLLNCETSH